MPIEVTSQNIKSFAKDLRSALLNLNIEIKHTQSLEIISRIFGYRDWNTISAKLKEPPSSQLNSDHTDNHIKNNADESNRLNIQMQQDSLKKLDYLIKMMGLDRNQFIVDAVNQYVTEKMYDMDFIRRSAESLSVREKRGQSPFLQKAR